MTAQRKRAYSVKQVSDLTGLSETKLRRMIKAEKLKVIWFERRVVVPDSALRELLQETDPTGEGLESTTEE